MENNVGGLDRAARVVIGGLLAYIYLFTSLFSGITNIVLLIVAVIFLATGIVGVCPMYDALGINTAGAAQKPAAAKKARKK